MPGNELHCGVLVVLAIQPAEVADSPLLQRLREAGFAVASRARANEIEEHLRPDVVVFAAEVEVQARRDVLGRVGDVLEVVHDGGDDAVVRELVTHLSRSRPPVRLGDIAVDLRTRTVLREGRSVALTHREAALFAWLLSRAGQVVSRTELLVNVWGYSPEMATRTVDITIGRLREKVEPAPRSPTFIQTVRGEGYVLRLPEVAAGAQSPADEGLYGRDEALERLRSEISPGRLVTLHGPGGVGKTAVARVFVATTALTAVWVDLVPVVAGGLEQAVATALSVPAMQATPTSLGRSLAHKRVDVLVLDNAEHIHTEVASFVDVIRDIAPGLCILATSRTRLRAAVEVLVAVGPLAPEPARELFLDRARRRVADYGASTGVDVLDGIVEVVDALPLAIELAAARAALMPPETLLERLRASTGWLRDRTEASRRTTLTKTVRWSWDLLDGREQEALAAASVFRGGAPLEGLEAMVGGEPGEAAELVDALLEHNLLWSEQGRVHPYVGVAAFAWDRLVEMGRDAEVVAAHEAYFADVALDRIRGLFGPRSRESLRDLTRERENFLRALMVGSSRAGDLALGLLYESEFSTARFVDFTVLEEAAARDLTPVQEARLLRVWLTGLYVWGRAEEMERVRARYVGMLPRLEPEEQAWVAVCLLVGHSQRLELDDAMHWFEQVETLAPGPTPQRMQARYWIAYIQRKLVGVEAAHRSNNVADEIASAMGSDLMRAGCRLERGVMLSNAGRHERALVESRATVEIYVEHDAASVVQIARTFLARNLVRSGRPAEALPIFEQCLETLADWGAPGQTANIFVQRSRALRDLRQLEASIADCVAVLTPAVGGRSPQLRHTVGALEQVMWSWIEAGDLAEARRAADELAEHEVSWSMTTTPPASTLGRARIALLAGDPAAAREWLEPFADRPPALVPLGLARLLADEDGCPCLESAAQAGHEDADQTSRGTALLWLALARSLAGEGAAAAQALASAQPARDQGYSLELLDLSQTIEALISGTSVPDPVWAMSRLAVRVSGRRHEPG